MNNSLSDVGSISVLVRDFYGQPLVIGRTTLDGGWSLSATHGT